MWEWGAMSRIGKFMEIDNKRVNLGKFWNGKFFFGRGIKGDKEEKRNKGKN